MAKRTYLPAQLDDIDMAILAHLRENAKDPLQKVAKEVGIHHNTMIQRVKRLEKEGTIKKYVAEVDYGKAGLDLHVAILMKVRRGRPGDRVQLDDLLAMKELEALYAITGMWDVLSLWRVRNREQLNELLKKIADSPSITKTVTHLILHPYKNPRDYNPFRN